jgi:amidophosphoribosyltransferase
VGDALENQEQEVSDEMLVHDWHEECGVFGVWRHPDAARLANYALYALQHRGQESAGVAVVDGATMRHHRGMGLVSEAFTQADLAALTGHAAIGHTRYSTTGGSTLANAQPLVFAFRQGNLALAHNGNLVHAAPIRDQPDEQGSIFQSTSDTEVVAHLIARGEHRDFVENVRSGMKRIEGGYALVLLTNDCLVALRGAGQRPLALGHRWRVVLSETCAFDATGATFVRDVESGETCDDLAYARAFCPAAQRRARTPSISTSPARL